MPAVYDVSSLSLQVTGRVHEAYLRLVDQEVHWQSRAQRGGGGQQMTLGAGDAVAGAEPAVDVLALTRLALNPEHSRLVELRYFAGLSIEETAEVLDVSPATVKRQWQVVRLASTRLTAEQGAR